MHVVALLLLATSVGDEAPLLAPDLGLGPYETSLLLRTPSPVPLLRTEERARAVDLLGKLRARGHHAVAFDAAAVVPSSAMLHVRSFAIEPDAFAASALVGATEGGLERVRWADIIAIVRVMHETTTERVEKTQHKKLAMGRAALSGGLLLTKNVVAEKTVCSAEREQMLYVYRRGGAPILISQLRTHYEGLGAELGRSSPENFARLVDMLRARAVPAAFDDRLLRPRPRAALLSAASSTDVMDLLAHTVGLAIGSLTSAR